MLLAQGDRAVKPIAWSGTSAEAAFLSSLSFRQPSSVSGVATAYCCCRLTWCIAVLTVRTLMLLMLVFADACLTLHPAPLVAVLHPADCVQAVSLEVQHIKAATSGQACQMMILTGSSHIAGDDAAPAAASRFNRHASTADAAVAQRKPARSGSMAADPASARVQSHHDGMGSEGGAANGGDSAALRALVERLPDLSYMLSDSLVVPSKGQ